MKNMHTHVITDLTNTSSIFTHLYCCCLGTNVVSFVVFWLFNAFYLFVDLTGWPKWVLQYKIQDGTNQPVNHLL